MRYTASATGICRAHSTLRTDSSGHPARRRPEPSTISSRFSESRTLLVAAVPQCRRAARELLDDDGNAASSRSAPLSSTVTDSTMASVSSPPYPLHRSRSPGTRGSPGFQGTSGAVVPKVMRSASRFSCNDWMWPSPILHLPGHVVHSKPVPDFPDRGIDGFGVSARGADMGLPLPRVHPSFQYRGLQADQVSLHADGRRRRHRVVTGIVFSHISVRMLLSLDIDLAHPLHEPLHLGPVLPPAGIGLLPFPEFLSRSPSATPSRWSSAFDLSNQVRIVRVRPSQWPPVIAAQPVTDRTSPWNAAMSISSRAPSSRSAASPILSRAPRHGVQVGRVVAVRPQHLPAFH